MTTDPIAAARELVERLDRTLGGVTVPNLMHGDNLAITLCTAYDNPDQDTDDETGWTPDAISGQEAVLSAIRAHYAPLADALEAERAKVAAAYEAAASVCRERHLAYEKMTARAERSGPSHPEYICDSTYHHWSGISSAYSEMQRDFRALTPADAQATLDKLLAEARLEGREIERQWQASIFRKVNPEFGYALPEPKEDSHG